jgi:hypothetical protein
VLYCKFTQIDGVLKPSEVKAVVAAAKKPTFVPHEYFISHKNKVYDLLFFSHS